MSITKVKNLNIILQDSLESTKKYLSSIGYSEEEIGYFNNFFLSNIKLFKALLKSFNFERKENELFKILESSFLLNFYARLLDNVLDENTEADKILFIRANLIPLKVVRNFSDIFSFESPFWKYFEKYLKLTLDAHYLEKTKGLEKFSEHLGNKTGYLNILTTSICFIIEKEYFIEFYEIIICNYLTVRQILNDNEGEITDKLNFTEYTKKLNSAINLCKIVKNNYFSEFLKNTYKSNMLDK